MMIFVYVPARGGSKGIPLKNLEMLGGKPLIQYTLDILKELIETFGDKIIPFISSDDDRILNFCASYGFTTEYRRPEFLSGDFSTIVEGINDGLLWLKAQKNIVPDTILLLQPTSPMRSFTELKTLVHKFKAEAQVSMFSVIPMKQHPYECISMEQGRWDYLQKPVTGQQRQSYKNNFYFIDGSYYMVTTGFLSEKHSFICSGISVPFPLEDKFAIDIDERMDLIIADAILKNRK